MFPHFPSRPRHSSLAVVIVCALLVPFLCPSVPGGEEVSVGLETVAGPLLEPAPTVAAGHRGLGCAACHGGPGAEGLHRQLPLSGGRSRAAMEERCVVCHKGYQLHEPQQLPGQVTCGDCHGEHAAGHLYKTTAANCVICHRDLQRLDGKPPRYANIPSWRDHRDFTLLRGQPTDPAQVVFSHERHDEVLAPGKKLVKLTCGSCHQPDPRGASMRPIRYSTHCQGCHPIAVRLAPEVTDQAARDEFDRWPALHLEADLVMGNLLRRLDNVARNHPAALASPPPHNWRPRLPGTGGPAAVGREKWIDRQLDEIRRQLFTLAGGRCVSCHVPEPGEAAPPVGALPRYQRTNITLLWLPNAKFAHEPHQIITCTKCHPVSKSRLSSDLHIPSVKTCAECHGAVRQAQPGRTAPALCSICHIYHRDGRARRLADPTEWLQAPPTALPAERMEPAEAHP